MTDLLERKRAEFQSRLGRRVKFDEGKSYLNPRQEMAVTDLERALVKAAGDFSPEAQERTLQGFGYETGRTPSGQLAVRKPGGDWGVVDPDTGFFSSDFLRDVGDIVTDVLRVGSSIAGGAAGAAGGPAGVVAGAAGGNAAAEAAIQGLARLAGFQATPGEAARSVAIEGALGAGGELLGLAGRGVGKGLGALARKGRDAVGKAVGKAAAGAAGISEEALDAGKFVFDKGKEVFDANKPGSGGALDGWTKGWKKPGSEAAEEATEGVEDVVGEGITETAAKDAAAESLERAEAREASEAGSELAPEAETATATKERPSKETTPDAAEDTATAPTVRPGDSPEYLAWLAYMRKEGRFKGYANPESTRRARYINSLAREGGLMRAVFGKKGGKGPDVEFRVAYAMTRPDQRALDTLKGMKVANPVNRNFNSHFLADVEKLTKGENPWITMDLDNLVSVQYLGDVDYTKLTKEQLDALPGVENAAEFGDPVEIKKSIIAQREAERIARNEKAKARRAAKKAEAAKKNQTVVEPPKQADTPTPKASKSPDVEQESALPPAQGKSAQAKPKKRTKAAKAIDDYSGLDHNISQVTKGKLKLPGGKTARRIKNARHLADKARAGASKIGIDLGEGGLASMAGRGISSALDSGAGVAGAGLGGLAGLATLGPLGAMGGAAIGSKVSKALAGKSGAIVGAIKQALKVPQISAKISPKLRKNLVRLQRLKPGTTAYRLAVFEIMRDPIGRALIESADLGE